MVSQETIKTDVPPTIGYGHDRGFVTQEMAVVSGPGYGSFAFIYRPFWRPVVGGVLLALSIFVLSWYLMLGCHVGITETGVLALGAGAAIWMWVTACVAFFFGGMVANGISAAHRPGWLKGLAVWALSIPLAIVIYGFAAHANGLLGELSLPQTGMAENVAAVPGTAYFGFYWSVFITLACALIFSVIGGTAGCACNRDDGKTTHMNS
jgi:hypothetical protein